MGRSASPPLAVLLSAAVAIGVGCTHSTLSLGSGTPVPTGSGLTVLYYRTVSGTGDVTLGECAGIGFHDPSGRFGSATTIAFLNSAGSIAFGPFDTTGGGGLTVDNPLDAGIGGFPSSFPPADTDYPCRHLSFDPTGLLGSLSAEVDFGAGVKETVPNVFRVIAPPPTPLTAGSTLGGETLPTKNSLAVYRFTAVAPYSIIALSSSSASFDPKMTALTTNQQSGYEGRSILMLPGPATYVVFLQNRRADATPGWTYTLEPADPTFATGADPAPADACAAATAASPAGVRDYTIDYGTLFNTSNPQSASNCSVTSPGHDGFLLFTVPAGASLHAGAFSLTDDPVLYILPVAGGCPLHPTTCDGAADDYGASDGNLGGGSGTEDSFYYNASGASQDVYLVIDNYNFGDTGIGYVRTELF